MKWIRRVLAAPLLLVTLICVIGMVKVIFHRLPDADAGTGVGAALFAVLSGGGAFLLLRPELRQLSLQTVRHWALWHPAGLAVLVYVVTAISMFVARSAQLLPGLVGMMAYSIAAPLAALRRPSWWIAVLWMLPAWLLLFVALASTSEAVTPRGFGEGAMVFLLPMEVFPVMLVISGVVRLFFRTNRLA